MIAEHGLIIRACLTSKDVYGATSPGNIPGESSTWQGDESYLCISVGLGVYGSADSFFHAVASPFHSHVTNTCAAEMWNDAGAACAAASACVAGGAQQRHTCEQRDCGSITGQALVLLCFGET